MTIPSAIRNLTVYGLTGNIGSGKSKAADFFVQFGAVLVDADLLAREVVAPGAPALTQIENTFGETVITEAGELNRKALGGIIFTDPDKRKTLETILHPQIRALYLNRLEKIARSEARNQIVIYAVPLLFESGFSYDELDGTIVVYAPKETCIERVMARDSCSRELAEKKYTSQIPGEAKKKKADFVIENDGSLDALREQVKALYSTLVKKRQSSGVDTGLEE
jgi:dephospho-CoA kinase